MGLSSIPSNGTFFGVIVSGGLKCMGWHGGTDWDSSGLGKMRV